MGCLLLLMASFFPRLGVLIIWIARPAYFSAAFGDSWLIPLLGILFLPFTTLLYVLMWTPGVGLTGWDWMWLAFALFIDISHHVGSAYANRNRIPGYPDSSATM
jgi:hypothetical protein